MIFVLVVLQLKLTVSFFLTNSVNSRINNEGSKFAQYLVDLNQTKPEIFEILWNASGST
jgi:hypothetical protein